MSSSSLRLRRSLVVAGLLSVATTMAAACGSTYGEDDADGAGVGVLHGRCFPNNTCNLGLVCFKDVCLQLDPDAQPSGSVDATTTTDAQKEDASLDGSRDGNINVDDASACTKGPNGSDCTSSSDCCSNACLQNHSCSMACKENNSGCTNALETNSCCVGLYCSSNNLCKACIPTNFAAELIGPDPNPRSCCSGQVNLGNGKCG